MKKILLSILAITAFSFGANAQVKGQLDALKELGEGAEFKEYYSIHKGDDGKWKGTPKKAVSVLKFEYNIHEKLSAFSMIDKETGKTSIYKAYGYMLPNHYTDPSVFHRKGPNEAFLYVEGLLYELEWVEDPNAITKIKIKYINIPIIAKVAEDTGEKKKLTMKEKLAAAKAKLAEANSGTPKEITDKDHIAIIKKYLEDMKPIQEKATASFSAEIKKEIEEINGAEEAFKQKLQDQNLKSSAELRKRQYRIESDANTPIRLITDSGTFTLSPHGHLTFLCGTDVYYCIGKNSKGSQVTVGKDSCGKTITLK